MSQTFFKITATTFQEILEHDVYTVDANAKSLLKKLRDYEKLPAYTRQKDECVDFASCLNVNVFNAVDRSMTSEAIQSAIRNAMQKCTSDYNRCKSVSNYQANKLMADIGYHLFELADSIVKTDNDAKQSSKSSKSITKLRRTGSCLLLTYVLMVIMALASIASITGYVSGEAAKKRIEKKRFDLNKAQHDAKLMLTNKKVAINMKAANQKYPNIVQFFSKDNTHMLNMVPHDTNPAQAIQRDKNTVFQILETTGIVMQTYYTGQVRGQCYNITGTPSAPEGKRISFAAQPTASIKDCNPVNFENLSIEEEEIYSAIEDEVLRTFYNFQLGIRDPTTWQAFKDGAMWLKSYITDLAVLLKLIKDDTGRN